MDKVPEAQLVQDFETRRDYLRGDGFMFLSNVNARFLESVAARPIPAIGEPGLSVRGDYDVVRFVEANGSETLHQRTMALFLAMHHLVRQNDDDSAHFEERFGITDFDRRYKLPADTENSHTIFGDGFEDIAFSWYFSGALASACLESKLEQGFISQD